MIPVDNGGPVSTDAIGCQDLTPSVKPGKVYLATAFVEL